MFSLCRTVLKHKHVAAACVKQITRQPATSTTYNSPAKAFALNRLIGTSPIPSTSTLANASGSVPPTLATGLTRTDILELPSTPAASPAYPRGPYTFYNRQYFIIVFQSDPVAIRKRVPEPLIPNPDNLVMYEWISMPDSTGFGSYTESGVVIPCTLNGEEVNFTQSMFLDCEPPIAAGREIWGFPKKYAKPIFSVKNDTIFGTLDYASRSVATGTMVYKHSEISEDVALKALSKTSVNLKIIPDVDYKPKLAQLVGYNLTNIRLKGAWTGAARLQLTPHANAPVADFPVRKIITGKHFLADITLPYGRVMHDYIKEKQTRDAIARATAIGTGSAAISPNIVAEAASEAERTAAGFLTRTRVLASVCMPIAAPSYSISMSLPPALRIIKHLNREYFIIKYESEPTALRACLPELLTPNPRAEVLLMWVHTTGGGIGDYSKLDVLIPCTDRHGNQYNWGAQSYVDSSSSITLGREVYGMPQKFGQPVLKTTSDTLNGLLHYAEVPVATGTMAFKTTPWQFDEAQELIQVPHVGLKLIPDVDGSAAIAQLVRSDRTEVHIRSAFRGAARLELRGHVNAPLTDLPVIRMREGYHVVCDMNQPIGVVLHDYLVEKDSELE